MTSKKNNKNNTVIVDDNIRQTSIQIIQEYVNDEQLSKNIEQEIYNFSLKNASLRGINPKFTNIYFLRIYKPKIYSIISNLYSRKISNHLICCLSSSYPKSLVL